MPRPSTSTRSSGFSHGRREEFVRLGRPPAEIADPGHGAFAVDRRGERRNAGLGLAQHFTVGSASKIASLFSHTSGTAAIAGVRRPRFGGDRKERRANAVRGRAPRGCSAVAASHGNTGGGGASPAARDARLAEDRVAGLSDRRRWTGCPERRHGECARPRDCSSSRAGRPGVACSTQSSPRIAGPCHAIDPALENGGHAGRRDRLARRDDSGIGHAAAGLLQRLGGAACCCCCQEHESIGHGRLRIR